MKQSKKNYIWSSSFKNQHPCNLLTKTSFGESADRVRKMNEKQHKYQFNGDNRHRVQIKINKDRINRQQKKYQNKSKERVLGVQIRDLERRERNFNPCEWKPDSEASISLSHYQFILKYWFSLHYFRPYWC